MSDGPLDNSPQSALELPIEVIAQCVHCPLANAQLYWPQIAQCLISLNQGTSNSQIGALATIAIETAWTFKPLHEYGSDKLHEAEYGAGNPKKAAELHNTKPGDGAKYAGRGFIQLTGEFNYEHYAKLVGIKLVENPDEATEKDAACAIFASYWYEHQLATYCDAGMWDKVRKRVNGGLNGYPDFLRVIGNLNLAIRKRQSDVG